MIVISRFTIDIFKSSIFSFLLVVIFPFDASAYQNKSKSDTLVAIQKAVWQRDRAYNLGVRSVNDSSAYYFNKAKETFKKYEDWQQYVNVFNYEGSLYSRQKRFDKGVSTYKRAISLARKHLAKDDVTILSIYTGLGFAYWRMKRYDLAIQNYLESLSLEKTMGEKRQFTYQYMNLAKVYDIVGDLNKSLEYWDKAHLLLQKFKMRKPLFAQYYDNKGDILFYKKEYDKAKEYKIKGLEIYTELNHIFGILGSYDFLGRIAVKTGDFKKGEDYYYKAIKLHKIHKPEKGNTLDKYLVIIYDGLGNVYYNQGKYEKAHIYFYKAYTLTEQYKIKDPSNLLGKNYIALQEYDSALNHIQRGINMLTLDFESENIFDNPSNLDKVIQKKGFYYLISAKAKAFRLKYLASESKDLKLLEAANKTNLLCLDLIQIMYNDFGSSSSKLDWADDMQPRFEEAITTAILLYNETKQKYYLDLAFKISEKCKAGILFSDIKSNKAKNFVGIPDSLLYKEKGIKSKLSLLKTRLNNELATKNEDNNDELSSLQETIFSLKRDHENLESLFEKEFPNYFKLKYNKEEIDINELQRNFLEENTTLLEYFVGDSSIYAFVIEKNRFEIKQLPSINSLSDKVKSIPYHLKNNEVEKYSFLAHNLYNLLIKPLNIKNQNLIIIPDGALWKLNFDLLITEKPQNLDFKVFSYLIKQKTINYYYSSKLLKENSSSKIASAKKECLAFSYNNDDNIGEGSYIAMRGFRDSEMSDLPGTRKEIKAVSSVVDGAYFYGSYANEKNFKENAKDYNILHLALHGVIDNEEPMNSKLYFSRSKNNQEQDSLEDNYLHAYELYNLELNAELAVLSACQTGAGKLIKGEGIMSIGRAFTYAGCKSLVLSQWDLSDRFTPDIMKDFYINLKAGESKSESLRQAKLSYLKNANNLTANPYFWAPLVQLGDNRPLKQDNYMAWVIGVTSLMIVVGLGIYWSRRSKHS